MAAHTRNLNMTEGVIWKQLVSFAFPMMLTNLLQQLYNTADTLVVGRFVGPTALAAVGGTGTIIFLIVGFFAGLSAGAGVVISQYFGAGNKAKLQDAVHTAIALSIVAGLVLGALGFALTPAMLRLIRTPENVLEGATLYLRINFAGLVCGTMYNLGAGILRAVGDSKRPLYFLMISGLINVGLNLVLVLVFHLGVAGVAIATVTSQLLSSIMILVTLSRTKEDYHFSFRKLTLKPDMLSRIVRLGFPAGIQSMAFSVSNIIIQSQINVFGSDAMAGQSAGQQIVNYIYMPLMALSLTITTFVGQNVGAGKWDRVRQGAKVCMVMSAAVTLAMSMLAVVLRRPLVGLYTTDANVLPYGMLTVLVSGAAYITYVPTDILAGVIRGSGNTLIPMIITLTCICLLRIVWLLIAIPIWHSYLVVVLCYPITWLIASICYIIYYMRGRWARDMV